MAKSKVSEIKIPQVLADEDTSEASHQGSLAWVATHRRSCELSPKNLVFQDDFPMGQFLSNSINS